MTATIRDVAEAAGVSITTVSHVLNGKGRTSDRVRQAVLKAVACVGYKVDPVARSLRTGKTGVLGIVFRPSDAISGSMNGTEYHIKLAGGAATTALNEGYGLLHVPDLEKGGLSLLPMDGCVVVAPHENDAVVTFLQERNMPFVLVDPDPGRPEFEWSIKRDDYNGMRHLLHHLAGEGAKRIAFFCGRDRNSWLLEAAKGYGDWCVANDHPLRLHLVSETEGPETAQSLAIRELTGNDPPDAVVTATSRFASGVVQAIEELSLSMPEDVRLSTLSDSELARANKVPITALDLHGDLMGRDSIKLLLRRLAGAKAETLAGARPTLFIRASTASP